MPRSRRSMIALSSLMFLGILATAAVMPVSVLAQNLPEGTDQHLSNRWQATHWGGPFQVDPSILEQRFREELERCEEPADVYEEISCHLFDGLQRMETGQLEPGREALHRCLELLEQEKDHLGKILILMAIAEAERYFQWPEKAMALYQQAVDLTKGLANSSLPLRFESFRLFARLTGQPEALFDQIAPMMQMMRPMFVNMIEVLVRDSYGMMLLDMGEIEAARHELERAVELSRRLFGLHDAQVLDHLARVHHRAGEFDRAAELYDQALAAAERMGDLGQQYGVLDRTADLESERGQFETALLAYEKALEVARKAGHPGKEAEILLASADLYGYLGKIEVARERLRAALEAAERSADPWVSVQAQMSSAALSFWTGYYELAIETLELTLDLLDDLGIEKPEIAIVKISALNLLSQAYLILGRHEQVESRAREALILAARFDFQEGMAVSQAMLEWSPEGDPERYAALMVDLASAFRASDVSALRSFGRQATSAFQTWGVPAEPQGPPAWPNGPRSPDPGDGVAKGGTESPWPHFRLVSRIGEAIEAGREERYEDGIQILEKLVADSAEAKHRDFQALGMMLQAAFSWKAGHKKAAADLALEGLDRTEEIVGDFRAAEVLAIFMGGYRAWLYDVTIEILIRTDHAEKAFDIAEQARARALLHQLGNQRLGDLDAVSDLQQRLRESRSKVEAMIRRGASKKELAAVRIAYDELLVRAQLEHPESAELLGVEPATLAELRGRLLPPETTLVSYFFTHESLVAWVVDRQGVAFERLAGNEELRSEILCFSRRVGRSPRGADLVKGCRAKKLSRLEKQLYETLWRPLSEHVRHENVIVVPHRELHYLPFASLRDKKGGYLAEQKTLSFLPSISVFRHIDRKRTAFESRVLILGDPAPGNKADAKLPRLDGARAEAESIAGLFGARAWFGEQAKEAKIWDARRQIDLLHIAAHGVFRPQAPRFSRIALAEGDGHDGNLEVEEVYRALDLEGVDLVTLSACQTALGELTRGDEIIGLNRAFLYAGSPAVLSSLWRVDDQATAFWMRSFYQHLLDGASYAEAVRAAQVETRAHPRFEDPHYWAGFVLTGDPHRRWKEPLTPTETSAVEPSVSSASPR